MSENHIIPSTYSHIVITGASNGIGAALAAQYAVTGVHLSLTGRNEERLMHVAQICRSQGAVCDVHVGDVTDYAAMQAWICTQDQKQPITLLIANAGVSGGIGREKKPESFNQICEIFSVNTLAMIHHVNLVADLMQKRQSGHIAVVGSMAGFQAMPGAPAYTASKAAIHFYGDALHALLQPSGVSFSIICPGFVDTHMTQSNTFPMPFLISSEKAAILIQKGLRKKKKYIIFPWQMYLLSILAKLMPSHFKNWILQLIPSKNTLKL